MTITVSKFYPLDDWNKVFPIIKNFRRGLSVSFFFPSKQGVRLVLEFEDREVYNEFFDKETLVLMKIVEVSSPWYKKLFRKIKGRL